MNKNAYNTADKRVETKPENTYLNAITREQQLGINDQATREKLASRRWFSAPETGENRN